MTVDWLVVWIPLVGSVVLGFLAWFKESNRSRPVAVVLMLLAWLSLLWRGPAWLWLWFPGNGPMALSLSLTGILAALITMAVAVLIALFHVPVVSGWAFSLMLFAIGAANVAFMADHFLLRYVALEMVAVAIVLGQFLAPQGVGPRRLRRDYVLLRLGDAGLIAAILILSAEAGTLVISLALEAGLGLPASTLPWVIGGFLLAVLVKLGLWPLGAWQYPLSYSSSPLYMWLYLVAAPNLGLYLLYRIAPLLGVATLGTILLRWLAILLALVSMGRALLAASSGPVRVALLGALSAMMLVLATMAPAGLVWMALILTTLPRAALALAYDQDGAAGQRMWRDVAAVSVVLPLYLLLWWAGPEIGTLWRAVSELLLGLYLICAWRVARRLTKEQAPLTAYPFGLMVGLTLCSLLAYPVAWQPLLTALADVAHVSLAPPTMGEAAVHLLASPLLWLQVAYVAIRFTPLAPKMEARLAAVQAAGQNEQKPDSQVDWVFKVSVWLWRFVEQGFFESELKAVTGFARAWRDGIRFIEERILNADVAALVRFVAAWRDGSRYVEHRVLEGLIAVISRAILGSSRAVQRRHTGKLRHNLIWVSMALVLAVAVALAM